jgi:hypothetical protein
MIVFIIYTHHDENEGLCGMAMRSFFCLNFTNATINIKLLLLLLLSLLTSADARMELYTVLSSVVCTFPGMKSPDFLQRSVHIFYNVLSIFSTTQQYHRHCHCTSSSLRVPRRSDQTAIDRFYIGD